MADIIEIRRDGIGNAAVNVNITSVDNELTIALNGTSIGSLYGPANFQPWEENLTNHVVSGKPNILVFSLVNYKGGGTNPARFSGRLNIGAEEIDLDVTSPGRSVPQGLHAQTIVVLQR